MTKNKKSLVLMRDEENGGGMFYDFPIIQRQLKDDILITLHKHINITNPEESNDILTLVELKEELRGIDEILKIPFDVLIVVEKGKKNKHGKK